MRLDGPVYGKNVDDEERFEIARKEGGRKLG